jgi:hypothetical protein
MALKQPTTSNIFLESPYPFKTPVLVHACRYVEVKLISKRTKQHSAMKTAAFHEHPQSKYSAPE